MSSEQNVFKKFVQQTENAVTASFIVAEKIACSSRIFTDENFVRSWINKVTKLLVTDQAHMFEKISLSRATILRRVDDIGQNISDQLSLKAKSFMCFSLAFDESSGIKDTAQLAVFIRDVSSELSVHKDLLSLISFCGCARGGECAKTLKMDHMMDVVIKCVNEIRTKSLKHQQF